MAEGLRFTVEVEDRGSPALRTFNAQLERTEKLSQAASGGFTRMEARIVAIGSAMEITARVFNVTVRALDQALASIVKRGDELQGLSRRLSINVETLSRFQYAAQKAGVDIEGLGQGFRKLASSLVEAERAGSNANKLLVGGLGLSIQQIKSLQGDPTKAVLTIAAAFNKYEDSARKTVAANELFGRGGQAFLQFFKEGTAEIEKNIAASDRLGQTWRTTQSDAAANLGDAVEDLAASLDGLRTKILGNEELMTRLTAVVERVTNEIVKFTQSLTPEQLDATAQGIVNMAEAFGKVAEAVGGVVTWLAQVAAYLGSSTIARFFGGALVGGATGLVTGPGAILGAAIGGVTAVGAFNARDQYRANKAAVLANADGNNGGFSSAGPNASFATPQQLASMLAGGRSPALPPFPGGGVGGGGGSSGGGSGEADKQARALESYNHAVEELRDQLTLLQDPTQKVRQEQDKLLEKLEASAKAAGVKLTPEIIELTRRIPALTDELEKNKKALEDQAKAAEEGAKLARSLSDRIEEMQDPLAKTRHEFRDLREEAAKLPNAVELNPMIDQLERAAIATEQWGAIFDQLADVAANALSGIILGTRSAADAFEGLKVSAINELTQIAIGVAKAGVISAISGTPQGGTGTTGAVINVLFGAGGVGSGGGIVGSLFGGGSGTTGGGGLFSGLLGGGGATTTGSPPTLGIPSLLQQALFGGGSGALVAVPLATTFASASSGATALAQGAVLANTGLISGIGAAGPLTAGGVPSAASGVAAGAGVGISAATAYAGLIIALGLGAKGIADTRSQFGDVTLGAAGSNAAKNRLTAIQGITLGAATAAGAGIGAGVGTAAFPVIGTVIGAGVGAAVGAAVAQAVGSSATGSIGAGVGKGITQKQLESNISSDLLTNPLLLILGGLAHVLASKVLGPAVAPDIENIFAKVFRGALGGKGGLNTKGLAVGIQPQPGDPQLGQAGQASAIIGRALGVGGQAFGDERRGNFAGLLLAGIDRRIQKTGEDRETALSEAFIGAFRGRYFAALAAGRGANKNRRQGDVDFVNEQFAKGSGSFGFDFSQVSDRFTEKGAILPGGKAARASREAVGQAIGAALQAGGSAVEFRRSMATSFEAAFIQGTTAALTKGQLGEVFADFFRVNTKRDRGALRRAVRQRDSEAEIAIRTKDAAADVEAFAKQVNDPAFAKGIAVINDQLFKLAITVAAAGDDMGSAVATIEGRLAPFVEQVRATQQLQRDVRSRVAFLSAGPGFAQGQAQVDELTRQRKESEDSIRRRFGGGISELSAAAQFLTARGLTDFKPTDSLFGGGLQAPLGGFPKGIDAFKKENAAETLTKLQEFSNLRLSELEAEAALARQMRDFYRDIRLNFEAFREQIDVVRRGPRAVQDILTKRQDEVRGLLAAAQGPEGEDKQRAIATIAARLPEILQLGGQLFAPGSAGYDALLTFTDGIAQKLGIDAGVSETASEKRLADAVANAKAFAAEITPILAFLEIAATDAVLQELQKITDILGGDISVLGVLHQVRDNLSDIVGKQQGGPVTGGGTTNVAGPSGTVGDGTTGGGFAFPQTSAGGVTVPIYITVDSGAAGSIGQQVAKALRAKEPELVREVDRRVAAVVKQVA